MLSPGFFPAGCFGKLPIYGDFIRHHASGAEINEFDAWLQQGLEIPLRRMEREWEADFKNGPTYHFLFHGRGVERFIVGILQPSWDQSGRLYPFMVFLQVDRVHFGNNLTLAPVIFQSFFEQALTLTRGAAMGLELREISPLVERLQFPIPMNWDAASQPQLDWLAATTLETFWTSLFGRFDDQRKFLLFKNLTKLLLRLRQYDPAQMLRGLRFPLSGVAASKAHEASFWLQVTWRVLRKPVVTPTLFWTAPDSGKRPYLFLFFRRPAERNLLPLIKLERDKELFCALDEDDDANLTDTETTIALPYRMILRELLHTKELKLLDFLQNL